MGETWSEIKYYLKIIFVLLAILLVIYFGIRVWKLEAVQEWIWGAVPVLVIIAYFVRAYLIGRENDRRKQDLLNNGLMIIADFVSLDVFPSLSNLMLANHKLTVKGIDPISGQEKEYQTDILGLNQKPKKKEIPKQYPVYIDQGNPDNYYVDVSQLTD